MLKTHRHFRHIESPQGAGTLHNGERLFARVTYGLRVLQEIIGTRQWSGASATKGVLQITGRFDVTSGSLPSKGDQLTLRLDDGRTLAFQVASAGPTYAMAPTIAPAGGNSPLA